MNIPWSFYGFPILRYVKSTFNSNRYVRNISELLTSTKLSRWSRIHMKSSGSRAFWNLMQWSAVQKNPRLSFSIEVPHPALAQSAYATANLQQIVGAVEGKIFNWNHLPIYQLYIWSFHGFPESCSQCFPYPLAHDGSMVLVYMLTLGAILMGSMLPYIDIYSIHGSVMGYLHQFQELLGFPMRFPGFPQNGKTAQRSPPLPKVTIWSKLNESYEMSEPI